MSTMPSPSSASHSHQVELQENVVLHGDEGEKFTFAELATATNNFAADREIGKGGFGTVYIGYLLPDGRDEVAIKRTHKDETYGTTAKEFMAELRAGTGEAPASSTVPEDEEGGGAPDRLRVHQQRLASRPPARYNAAAVVLVVAGEDVMELEDAHRDTAGRVASHRIPVVLQRATGDHPPRHQLVKHAVRRHLGATLWRLADFGASVRCDHSTRSVPADAFYGKFGYIDLEYATTAIAKPTIDVYSFGVVMLEVLTGMRALFYQEEDVHKVFDCSEEDRNAIPAVLAEVTPPFIEVGEFGLVKRLQFGLWKCFGYQLAAMVLRPTYMSVSIRTTATNEVLDRSCCADNHARCYSDSTLILSERVAHSKSATATVGGGRGRRELAVIDGTLRRKGSPCAYTTATTTSNSTFA
uniref:Protein kinase domain-containing protein n=1 Tax=Oryza rufipogon TaxID=4529 RepID=A0A0E0RBU6_ORYRU